MAFGLSIVTAPASEPVTLAEAKAQLRIDHSDSDTEISAFISAAREKVERDTRRALITQTWKYQLDNFSGWAIKLPYAPLQSITSIQYLDESGNTQTFSSGSYTVDIVSDPGRVYPNENETWPTTQNQLSGVTITYVCGYGSASDVPNTLKQAILLLLSHWYCHREAVGRSGLQEVPLGYKSLISSYILETPFA